MGFSINTLPYTGGSQTFDLSFALGYIEESDVAVQVVGEVDGTGQPINRLFVFNSENEIEVVDPLPNPCEVRLVRTVDKENPPVDFSQPGSATREAIELSQVHTLMAVQEALDGRISGSEFTADEALSEIREGITQARAWAETDEDTEVDAVDYPGEFSARHHAIKAAASAAAAAESANSASDGLLGPFTGRAALVAWNASNTAEDGVIASDGTVLYKAVAGSTVISDLPGWVPYGHITPNHFGLVSGDSVGTTNQDAWMAAIAYADGVHPVYCVPGSYGLSARINVDGYPGTRIIAPGVTIYAQSGMAIGEPLLQFWINSENCTLEGLVLDGVHRIRYGLIARADVPNARNCTFVRCGSTASGYPFGYGIYLDGEQQDVSRQYITGAVVSGCRFENCLGGGIGQWSSLKANISGCTFYNMGLEMITCDRPSSDDLVITGCVGDMLCVRAGVGGIGIDDGDGWVISDTVIRNTQTGIDSGLFVPGIGIQNNLGDTLNGLITGCSISGCNGGIYARTTGTNAAGPGGTTTNLTISGCTMWDNNSSSVIADAGTTGVLYGNNYGGDDPDVPFTWKGTDVSFRVTLGTNQTNVTGDFTNYDVPFDTSEHDTASAVTSGVFTAPRAAYYTFGAQLQAQGITAEHTDMEVKIVPSGSAPTATGQTPTSDRSGRCGCSTSTEVFMSAGDTAKVSFNVGGGTNPVVVDLLASDSTFNHFWGHLSKETS